MVILGSAGRDTARLQLQTAALRALALSAALKESRLGMAWIGKLRTGDVGRGAVIAADGSTELRKRLPAALFGE